VDEAQRLVMKKYSDRERMDRSHEALPGKFIQQRYDYDNAMLSSGTAFHEREKEKHRYFVEYN
jgi:hypothetical protein